MTTKFDTVESTVKALTDHKKPDCVVALTNLFYQGLENGLTNRQATAYAEASHFLQDHNGYDNLPELTIEATDEAVHTDLYADIEAGEHAGEATLLLQWFDLLRSWNVPVQLAYTIGLQFAEDEWDDTHDGDEAEAIKFLEGIPTADDEDEAIKQSGIERFRELRAAGNSVNASVKEVRDQISQAFEMKLLFALLSGELDLSEAGRDLLN